MSHGLGASYLLVTSLPIFGFSVIFKEPLTSLSLYYLALAIFMPSIWSDLDADSTQEIFTYFLWNTLVYSGAGTCASLLAPRHVEWLRDLHYRAKFPFGFGTFMKSIVFAVLLGVVPAVIYGVLIKPIGPGPGLAGPIALLGGELVVVAFYYAMLNEVCEGRKDAWQPMYNTGGDSHNLMEQRTKSVAPSGVPLFVASTAVTPAASYSAKMGFDGGGQMVEMSGLENDDALLLNSLPQSEEQKRAVYSPAEEDQVRSQHILSQKFYFQQFYEYRLRTETEKIAEMRPVRNPQRLYLYVTRSQLVRHCWFIAVSEAVIISTFFVGDLITNSIPALFLMHAGVGLVIMIILGLKWQHFLGCLHEQMSRILRKDANQQNRSGRRSGSSSMTMNTTTTRDNAVSLRPRRQNALHSYQPRNNAYSNGAFPGDSFAS